MDRKGDMDEADPLWHGGDLGAARRLFPEAPGPWVDLSTGINPIHYPLPALPASLWQHLPSAADEAAALAAARRAYRVPADAGAVAAPGTQILIDLLPRIAAAQGDVAVIGPTYGEHARSWTRAGRQVREAAALEETCGAGIVVVVNPNNPDGRIVPAAALATRAGELAGRGGLLVVDEAFADFTPEASILPDLPPSALVLRSFGKTYGLAGVRLGFAFGPQGLTEAMRQALGPWAVSGPALAIGAAALDDAGWLAAARAARTRDAARLDALLSGIGRVVGGTVLFRLVETADAPGLFRRLGAAGIYVRRFRDRPHLLRFGLPAGDAQWRRLAEALA